MPGRTDKQEQEEISPNHVQRINLISVLNFTMMKILKINEVKFEAKIHAKKVSIEMPPRAVDFLRSPARSRRAATNDVVEATSTGGTK